ncbi:MAG: hypothetical protein HY683_09775 [Chloroflexi bacterium]|nr:hypothetical protein [Chloroflexota bacterium]
MAYPAVLERRRRETAAQQLPLLGADEAAGCTIPCFAPSRIPKLGQAVIYLGRLPGGPVTGACGRVVRLGRANAVVHFRRHGLWHIPYYFLGLPTTTSTPQQEN